MRTSGASTETPIVVAVCCIALGLLVLFAGGPNELLRVLERGLQSVVEIFVRAYQSIRA